MVIFGARNDQFTMLAPHHSKQNHLLAALPAADYERLEARVCECYAVVKRESDRLLSGKTAIVGQLS